MIVIAGTVPLKPEARAEAIAVARTMVAATRREPGCRAYRFSLDLDDQNLVCIFEEWEDAEALAAHFASDHMRVFREQLPRLIAGVPALRRYEIASAAAM